ncbi:phosphoglycerate mutase-like protein [Lophiostoma macrostomum CBS 122681]|uniref:Phosphoglycerate mutase-like protein n=1 Tax=Lophiostoma macrostomum CBS 122681 TaxID=1314788 RepID=A0A6A6TR49_9PLEO|nr:phosphoglycerate mutase-like protein [Lophiostoma macrostomum CBS 122681]
MSTPATEWTFSSQHGFFSHDDDPESWDFRATTRPNLGILNRSYDTDQDFDPQGQKTQWQRFEHWVREMNKIDPSHRQYKIFYAIRHGQGIHNVKESEVGREEWDRHWSKLSGDGTLVWEDAELTPVGEQQAKDIATFFATSDVPAPECIFSSPLRRCLHTTELAYAGRLSTTKPVIKEKLRERLGVHTCDKRSTKSWIADAHPIFAFESGFPEHDELWKPDVRETLEEHIPRVKELLDDIFRSAKDATVISLTAHSGALMTLFRATGWKRIPVAAGAVYPLLILAERDS